MFFFGSAQIKSDFQLGQFVIERLNYYYDSRFNKKFSSAEIAKAMGYNENALVDGLGFQYRIGLDESESKLNLAMETLAAKSGGKIPSKATLDNAMREAGATYTFLEAAKAVTVGTIEQLGKEAQKIGDSVLSVAKYVPYLLVIGGGAWLYFKFREKK